MAPHIGEEVGTLMEDPAEDQEVALVIGVHENARATLVDRLEEVGATDIEQLPFNGLRVVIPETVVSTVCDLHGIKSVELDEGMEILTGN